MTNREIDVGGSDRAKITKPIPFEDRPNLYSGQILVWAEIDAEGKWLNKEKNKEATPAEKKAAVDAIPPNLEPNFRPFTYIWNDANHRLVFETRSDLGHRFSPKRAERFFVRLFETLSDDPAELDVTIIPEDETVAKILAIPRLRKLLIYVKRPNADDAGGEYERIIAELEAEGAQSQKIEKVKAPKKKSLTPTAETRVLAEKAAYNGYVSGEGKDDAGNPIRESTREHPKLRAFDVHTSTIGTILAGLHRFD